MGKRRKWRGKALLLLGLSASLALSTSGCGLFGDGGQNGGTLAIHELSASGAPSANGASPANDGLAATGTPRPAEVRLATAVPQTIGVPSGAVRSPLASPDSPSGDNVSFRESITEFFIGQEGEAGSQEVVAFEEGRFPREARTYSLQMEKVYGFFTLKPMSDEKRGLLLASIRAKGARISVQVENPDYNPMRYFGGSPTRGCRSSSLSAICR